LATGKYQTRGDRKRIPPDREQFKEEDLLKLPELRPPTVMPQGNVGTPTMFFMKLIRDCKLPPSIIKKLQLDFPKSKGKGKYGSVPLDYHTDVVEVEDSGDEEENGPSVSRVHRVHAEGGQSDRETKSPSEQTFTSSSSAACQSRDSAEVVEIAGEEQQSDHEVSSEQNIITSVDESKQVGSESGDTEQNEIQLTETQTVSDYKELRRRKKQEKRERRRMMAERIEEKMIEFEKAGSDSGDDNDTCEEWERHEAMYDDVTNQGRNKDRLFEEEMEVVWEKGGSGLVFYTDAQYWQEEEGDFDEQTADDLDVDMSAYYEQGAGDPDIRDFLTIRQEQRRRRGLEKTDRFSAGISKSEQRGKTDRPGAESIGKFEKHTKGVGRKIMEKQGWKEGSGLGSTIKGIADALDTEGQHPRDRKGLGYHGEKLVRYGLSAPKKRRPEGGVIISTIYDNPSQTNPVETLHRRKDETYVKHRGRIN
jgi:hypothetical protein